MKTLRDESARAKLVERIDRLSLDSEPAWGKMSVDQMLSHLVQANEMPFIETVPPHDNFLSRKIVKPLILYVLPIPKEVKVSARLDQQREGRKPLGFEVDKRLVKDAIDKLGTIPIDQECLGHPFFGTMSAKEWAVLAYKHIDHHLKQFGV